MQKIKQRAAMNRIPLSGTMEITHRCNLRCQHCYLGSQTALAKQPPAAEMDTATIFKILDEITAAGCLNLLLTGGDPLMRKDFIDIYQYAVKKGLLLRVFTNGTMITEEIVALFKKFPPVTIEITLYGATEQTYEKVTGIAGSYKRCLQGIEKLLAINVPLVLKTVVMTLNKHEFFAIEQLAKNLGTRFRYDCIIRPQLDGDKRPMRLRLLPEEVIAIDFATAERSNDWVRQDKEHANCSVLSKVYNCGAGRYSFHVDPYGNLMPCITAVRYKYSLLTGSFQDGWDKFFPPILEQKVAANFKCGKCPNIFLCSFCPATFYLENGSEVEHSAYMCQIGHLRRAKIKQLACQN